MTEDTGDNHPKDLDPFENEIFKVNEITFKNVTRYICMQSENGPCPLIALINILLLRGDIKFENDLNDLITGKEMLNVVADYLLSKSSELPNGIEEVLENLQQLKSGLSVDVKFSGVSDFAADKLEKSDNMKIFKLLGINLYHGWLMELEDDQMKSMCDMSYEEAALAVLDDSKSLCDEMKANLKEFLQSPGIITYRGLIGLHEKIEVDELCILFHDNHFSVVHRYKDGILYLLITDIGYHLSGGNGEVKEQNRGSKYTWQALTSVTGDMELVDDYFQPIREDVTINNEYQDVINMAGNTDEEIARKLALEQDYNLATELQNEENQLVLDSEVAPVSPSNDSNRKQQQQHQNRSSLNRQQQELQPQRQEESICAIL